jgi:hypothetical protein
MGLIAFDCDDVLTPDEATHWRPLEELEPALVLIREAQARGFAVALMTCHDVRRVVRELRRHGMAACPDLLMARRTWSSPSVLVSNLKPAAHVEVGGRHIRYRYGEPSSDVWTALG